MHRLQGDWGTKFGPGSEAHSFQCGYCGLHVSSSHGTTAEHSGPSGRGILRYRTGVLLVCPSCNRPSFLAGDGKQYPAPLTGQHLEGLPDDVASLHGEVRRAISVGAFTAAVLTARKLLMHIAVDKGAEPNLRFVKYVMYLRDEHWIPPNGTWLEYILSRSNEENHEIVIATREVAEKLLGLTEHLLRSVYILPSMAPMLSTDGDVSPPG